MKEGEVLEILRRKHANDAFFAHVKTGPTNGLRSGELLVLDAMAFKRSWVAPLITGYEVKVSRSDFLRDQKWTAYVQFCSRLYLVCPPAVARADEIPEGLGLMHVREDGGIRVARSPRVRKVDPDPLVLYYLVTCRDDDVLGARRDGEKERPSWRGGRAREWLEGRREDRDVGGLLRTRLALRVEELAEKIEEREREIRKLRGHERDLLALDEVLRSVGVSRKFLDRERWTERLRIACAGGAGVDACAMALREMRSAVRLLEKAIGPRSPLESEEEDLGGPGEALIPGEVREPGGLTGPPPAG